MERITISRGKSNIICVCPHGPDDLYTPRLTSQLAQNLNAYSVINHGFKKSDKMDSLKDLGNCNDLFQLFTDDVMYDEFLKPVLQFKKHILEYYETMFMFIVHGFGTHTNLKDVDIILGYGAGKPNRFSCHPIFKDNLIHLLPKLRIKQASAGSPYAGWKNNNLNQLFTGVFKIGLKDPRVNSLQLEISYFIRNSSMYSLVLSQCIKEAMDKLLNST